MRSFELGMAQMLVQGGKPEANLARAAGMIAVAADRGCRAVLLPECLDLGWTHPSARERAQPIPGRHSDILAAAARRHGLYVVAGLVERQGPRLFNAAILISPEGEILLKHHKINELDFARELYSTGQELAVVDTELGRVGIPICADNWPTSLALGHALGLMGAELLLSPCAWAVPAEHDNCRQPYGGEWEAAYAQLAIAHGMTIVGVSNVGWIEAGPWQGRKCIGCSLAMARGGTVLAQAPYGEDAETLLLATIPGGGA